MFILLFPVACLASNVIVYRRAKTDDIGGFYVTSVDVSVGLLALIVLLSTNLLNRYVGENCHFM